MKDGFLRIAAATTLIRVADCTYNADGIVDAAMEAAQQGASLAVFPELCVTGYTCGDLFLQRRLLDAAEQALMRIAERTKTLDMLVVVGLPIRSGMALYNCGAVVYLGDVLGFVPKTHIPDYAELNEQRYFSPAPAYQTIEFQGRSVALGNRLLFACENMPEFCLGLEICEDLSHVVPPSAYLCAAGATVVGNLSASSEIVGRAAYRRSLVTSQSGRCVAAYVYSEAGEGESSTDLVFAGHSLIAENGALMAEARRFATGIVYEDVDVQRIQAERRRRNTYPKTEQAGHIVGFRLPQRKLALRRRFSPLPFVPEKAEDLAVRCKEILSVQVAGLSARLRHTGCKKAVVGLSGGLDSTLALIVLAHAFDALALPREGILAVSMPCFGTTVRTRGNAAALCRHYGATLREIPIEQAVIQHFKDIQQPLDRYDTTFENGQARERTQVLMDLANQQGALVVGTGDLSELALGWATYNGDHMSMYGVNACVPKTIMRHLIAHEAKQFGDELETVLRDVLDTPVSPELLPLVDGEIVQKTEDIVGPYELHDFFLYYMLRFGFSPSKIFRLACLAFEGLYDPAVIKKWLAVFVRRFFAQQFKRSCLPDGPKVGSVGLSPRGDFRMPSDACSSEWMKEIEELAVD
ncbi:MAG: NAD(+) synthase [Christensenellales bacterium]